MRNIFIYIIKIYQLLVSPIMVNVFGSRCRFSVTCSEYAIEKIANEGIFIGSIKSIKRIAHCSPFSQKYEYI